MPITGFEKFASLQDKIRLALEVCKTLKVTSKGKVVGVSARLTQDVLEDFFRKAG